MGLSLFAANFIYRSADAAKFNTLEMNVSVFPQAVTEIFRKQVHSAIVTLSNTYFIP